MAAIRHIEFWVSDLKKSLDFYTELFTKLGWENVDGNGFAFDGTKIYFLESDEISHSQEAFGPRHICFAAKNQETVDVIAQLPMISAKTLHGPAQIHEGGSYMLVFKDPDGYILEVAHKGE